MSNATITTMRGDAAITPNQLGWSFIPSRRGSELDRDGFRKGLLLPNDALLQPQGRTVRRDVEAA
jgi:hypothetical protein